MIRDEDGNEEVCVLVLIVDGCTPVIDVITGRGCLLGARELMMNTLDEKAEQQEPKARRVRPLPPGISGPGCQNTDWHPSIQRVLPTPAGWVEVCTSKNAWAGICWRPIFSGSPHHVRGIVTWKDEPITGEITFADTICYRGHKAGTTRALIKHGHYEVHTTPGMKQVRLKGKSSKGLSLPARYNTKSKLRFEVEPHHKNVFDIALP